MSNYTIITDSCCDFDSKMVEKLGITVLPLTLCIDGKEYRNLPDGSELSPADFYAMLRSGKSSTTSAVNMQAFVDAFTKELSAGNDVIYLAFSSGLSATFRAAELAAEEVRPQFPERKVFVIDTLCASLGQGLLVYLVCKQRDKGATIERAAEYAESIKPQLAHWFTVDDLHHLKRGGRVSPAVAIIGTALGVKPIMHADDDGKLAKVGTVRGRKNSIAELVKHMKETAIDVAEQTVYISHGDCLDDAKLLADMIVKELKVKAKNIYINYVGPVIGSHSGPGTLALFFLGTTR